MVPFWFVGKLLKCPKVTGNEKITNLIVTKNRGPNCAREWLHRKKRTDFKKNDENPISVLRLKKQQAMEKHKNQHAAVESRLLASQVALLVFITQKPQKIHTHQY